MMINVVKKNEIDILRKIAVKVLGKQYLVEKVISEKKLVSMWTSEEVVPKEENASTRIQKQLGTVYLKKGQEADVMKMNQLGYKVTELMGHQAIKGFVFHCQCVVCSLW